MTTPGKPAPEGAYVIGGGEFGFGSEMTETAGMGIMSGGARTSFQGAQDTHKVRVINRIDGAYDAIQVVEGHAGEAVTKAQAAANAAAVAETTAAAAYKQASYWETEFVVSSAAVVLGTNELLIGPVQNVPLGLKRVITDMHVALLSQPNGMQFELKKWNAANTVDSVLDTFTLAPGVNRMNVSLNMGAGFEVTTRERVFINVTSVTGTVAPVVFQPLIFGVLFDPTIQNAA